MTASYRPTASPDHRPDAPVRLRVREPADLLATVPYLLGFHPTESLVALFLRDGRVLLAARFDLACGLVEEVADLVEQHAVTGLVLVAYAADGTRGRAVLEEHRDGPADVELVDLLLVDGRRWWSLRCDLGCCPPEGLPYAPQEHPLSAEAVWAGLVARPDRASVVEGVQGPTGVEAEALSEQASASVARLGGAGRHERQDALARAVVAALGPAREGQPAEPVPAVDDAACVELAVLVQDVRVLDVACALVTREDAARHVALWQQVVARTPAALAPAPLCLLGVAAWADGNGTVLNACCDRVATLDPAYPMGRLLADVSRRALPPAWWDALADGLRRDLGLVG